MTHTPSEYDETPAATTGVHGDSTSSLNEFAPLSQSSAADDGYSTGSSGRGTMDTAKDEAGQVAGAGVQAAKEVASTAKGEAATVLAETKQQAASLFETARDEVRSQSGVQQQRLASGLHSLAQELGGMASGAEQQGQLSDLMKQAAQKGGEIAHWLETHEPADLLREVQSYARRRPVAFLALCGLAGIVAGRVARSAAAANTSLDSGKSEGHGARPALDVGTELQQPGSQRYGHSIATADVAATADRGYSDRLGSPGLFGSENDELQASAVPGSLGAGTRGPGPGVDRLDDPSTRPGAM